MKKAILFLNGEIDLQFCEHYLQCNDLISPIYCADGAWDQLINCSDLATRVCAVLGDFDSSQLSAKIDSKCIQLIELPDQNYTDFEKILERLSIEYDAVDIYGANGREMDHYLGNISVALKWMDRLSLRFIDQFGISQLYNQACYLSGVKDRRVSVIPLCRMQEVWYSGLHYSVNGDDLDLGGMIGIRNWATEDSISITCTQGKFIIFVSHQDDQHASKNC